MRRRIGISVMTLCLLAGWAPSGLAVSSTDRLPDDEKALSDLGSRLGWPPGTLALVNDPLREAGWHSWFSELPNDVYEFGYSWERVAELNRLIALLGEIEVDTPVLTLADRTPVKNEWDDREPRSLVFRIGSQRIMDAWYERLPVQNNLRVFGPHRYNRVPEALPPTMVLYLAETGVDPDQLDVPLHVRVQPLLRDENQPPSDPLEKGLAGRIQKFSREHGEKREEAAEMKPWARVACPNWAKVEFPRPLRHLQGKWGLPDPFPTQTGPIAPTVAGIDFWHANHFLVYREETAEYLYGDLAPFTVDYRPGSLYGYDRVVARYTQGLHSDREKAMALLTRAMPDLVAHPEMPPLGPACRPDRGADDEALLGGAKGWCNEQARVFVRLCQVSGIPARLIFLWYTPGRGGHVVAEFRADGHWSMADASWFCAFPDDQGRLMSARECHLDQEHKALVGKTYSERMQELDELSDEELVGRKFAHIRDTNARREKIAEVAAFMRNKFFQRSSEEMGNELWRFGVMPYPLPNEHGLETRDAPR